MTRSQHREAKKSIPLSLTPTPYQKGKRFLILPTDMRRAFRATPATVSSLEGNGAWFTAVDPEAELPEEETVFAVEFLEREVVTHTTRILKRVEGRAWLDLPSLSEREESQLAPFTGRFDYRVQADLPVDIRMCEDRPANLRQAQSGRLTDVSRGGLGVAVRQNCDYTVGQQLEIRLVSWEYPVNLRTEIVRVDEEDSQLHLALRFPADMNVEQKETVSTFVLQAQKREALSRDLPSEGEAPPASK